MATFLSLLLYLATFLAGIILDRRPYKSKQRKIYVVWLYIFLCFGYMTGSDWRSYELDFTSITEPFTSEYEPAFGIIYFFFKKILGDFFLTLGILKCFYLFSLIKLFKAYTNHYLLAIAISLPVSTLFVLIDNPLRFMVALTAVNIAILYLKKDKIIVCYAFLILAIFFHNSTVFFLLIPIILKFSPKVYSFSTFFLLCIYIGITYLSSNADLISSIQRSALGFVLQYIETKDYLAYYETTDNEAFFTFGSLIRIAFSCFIILTKKIVDKGSKTEKLLYGMAVCDMILSRILIMVPTGFRLAIPFGYFYAIYLASLFSKKSLVSYVIVGYLFLTMAKTLYSSYSYLPYSNSIIYIVTQNHDSYSYRCNYNWIEYSKRTGKSIPDK